MKTLKKWSSGPKIYGSIRGSNPEIHEYEAATLANTLRWRTHEFGFSYLFPLLWGFSSKRIKCHCKMLRSTEIERIAETSAFCL